MSDRLVDAVMAAWRRADTALQAAERRLKNPDSMSAKALIGLVVDLEELATSIERNLPPDPGLRK